MILRNRASSSEAAYQRPPAAVPPFRGLKLCKDHRFKGVGNTGTPSAAKSIKRRTAFPRKVTSQLGDKLVASLKGKPESNANIHIVLQGGRWVIVPGGKFMPPRVKTILFASGKCLRGYRAAAAGGKGAASPQMGGDCVYGDANVCDFDCALRAMCFACRVTEAWRHFLHLAKMMTCRYDWFGAATDTFFAYRKNGDGAVRTLTLATLVVDYVRLG